MDQRLRCFGKAKPLAGLAAARAVVKEILLQYERKKGSAPTGATSAPRPQMSLHRPYRATTAHFLRAYCYKGMSRSCTAELDLLIFTIAGWDIGRYVDRAHLFGKGLEVTEELAAERVVQDSGVEGLHPKNQSLRGCQNMYLVTSYAALFVDNVYFQKHAVPHSSDNLL